MRCPRCETSGSLDEGQKRPDLHHPNFHTPDFGSFAALRFCGTTKGTLHRVRHYRRLHEDRRISSRPATTRDVSAFRATMELASPPRRRRIIRIANHSTLVSVRNVFVEAAEVTASLTYTGRCWRRGGRGGCRLVSAASRSRIRIRAGAPSSQLWLLTRRSVFFESYRFLSPCTKGNKSGRPYDTALATFA